METSVIVVDDFYSDPEAVRRYALRQEYYYPYQSRRDLDRGRKPSWFSSRFKSPADCPFKSSRLLLGSLEKITGSVIDMVHWNLGFPLDDEGRASELHFAQAKSCLWNCSFHFKPASGQQAGEGVHNHVTDGWNAVGPNGWAGIVYLDPMAPLRGGLRTWKNIDPAKDFEWMTPASNWELIDDLGNVFNRLLLCRGRIPHSGADGWGDSLATGRLFQTFFFRVLMEPRSRGIEIATGEQVQASGRD